MNARASGFIDETAAWRAKVAAEVAARYDALVSPDVVQHVAPGESGIPALKWDGTALVYETPVNPMRAAIQRGYTAHKHAKLISTAISPEAQRRRDEVARLHALGLFDAQIMAELGVSLPTVRNIRYVLNLQSNGHLAQVAAVEARSARVLDMLQRGFAASVIATKEGLTEAWVKRIGREQLGMSFPRASTVKLITDVENAQRRALARINAPAYRAPAPPRDPKPARVPKRVHKPMADIISDIAARRVHVVALAREGLSQLAIARKLGCNRATVFSDLLASDPDRLGQFPRYHPKPERAESVSARRARVLALLQAGETCPAIGRTLGVAKSTIRGDCAALIAAGSFVEYQGQHGPVLKMRAKVLERLQQGLGWRDIAGALGISKTTFRSHRAALIASGDFVALGGVRHA